MGHLQLAAGNYAFQAKVTAMHSFFDPPDAAVYSVQDIVQCVAAIVDPSVPGQAVYVDHSMATLDNSEHGTWPSTTLPLQAVLQLQASTRIDILCHIEGNPSDVRYFNVRITAIKVGTATVTNES
ncbi:MAG TPA: hypothetical protein VG929_12250 [Actinomycetota bacterium]|nr:hypothetical protein [Actinomycetota bacterium]